jgi:PAS domain S-box-containing protein
MSMIPSTDHNILDSLALGVFTVDMEWRVSFFNKEAERITGFTRKAALGRRCYEIFRTDACYRDCYLQKAIATGRSGVKARVTILNRHNKEVPVEITASVMRGDSGEIIGGVESFLDDSPRVKLEKQLRQSYTFEDLVGRDEKITELYDILPVIARSDASILLTGETGTGKDLLARAIHNVSSRGKGPFIKVNCAALPDNLLESELFGYTKGAFTDAKENKPGRFHLAENGTIFLDEIGDLSRNLQAKLLQVLDEKRFYPLGSTKLIKVDVRVISSTNRDLQEMMTKARFREDLFYRLKVVEMTLPPLRERVSDIPLLIDHFITEQAASSGKQIESVSSEAMQVLLDHDYPGNVRELRNIIEYAAILCTGYEISKEVLPKYLLDETMTSHSAEDSGPSHPPTDPLAVKEKEALLEVLSSNGWNLQETAQILKIGRTTLWRKMKKHGLSSRPNQ